MVVFRHLSVVFCDGIQGVSVSVTPFLPVLGVVLGRGFFAF